MYALDNDTLSLLLRGQESITSRVEAASPDVWLPAIVLEEQIRGRMAFLASLDIKRNADSRKFPQAYDLLLRTFRQLEKFQFLPYTPEAEVLFQSWPAAVKRLGTRDCRIAATAIVHGFTVVTCNLGISSQSPASKLRIGVNSKGCFSSYDLMLRRRVPRNEFRG